MEIKDKIDRLRKQKGWSKSRLAQELGISATSVYNWYNEKESTPSRATLDDVCVVFNVSVSEFYTEVETSNLSDEDIQMLELFHAIPEGKRGKALEFLKLLSE